MGDKLVVLVGNFIAGLAEVSGPPFQSTTPVWDNDVFPHRVPISFVYASLPANRLPILGNLRECFVGAFQADWGLGIVNQWLMKPSAGETVMACIQGSPNDVKTMLAQIDELLASARQKRQAKRVVRKPAGSTRKKAASTLPATPVPESPDIEETPESPEIPESIHLQAQSLLIQLGRIVGCTVWVASNDRSRELGGRQLGADCLDRLPNMGLNAEATRAIGLIDVIWLKKNAPVAAFEVEATTSVHSGLLRMSDLVEVVPALKMDLYIVAPRERKAKVLRELARPTFRRIGLSDTCRFVGTDDLGALLKKLDGLKGFVNPDIIETIAIALPEQTESALA